MFPTIDIAPDLKTQINSCKIRMKTLEYCNGFNEFKKNADTFFKINNFSEMEIKSIYHLINSYYFMGKEL